MGFSYIYSLDIAAVLPMLLSIIFLYLLLKEYFSITTARLSAIILLLMPMNIWLISHRLMEPLQYLFSLAAFYYLKKYIDRKKLSPLILASIFVCAVLYIKITSLFVLVAAIIYLLLSRAGFKKVLIFTAIITILYSPYAIFGLKTRGTVSYSPPGLPIVDKYISNPWWNWPKNQTEKKLALESNQVELTNKINNYNRNKRSFIQDQLKDKHPANVLQDYGVLGFSSDANQHWFSPTSFANGFYLLIFIVGFFVYVTRYRRTDYSLFLLPLFILVTYYLMAVAELRYFYIFNILLIVFSAIGFLALIKTVRNPQFEMLLCCFFAASLLLVNISEVNHSRSYHYSIAHNLTPVGTGLVELKRFYPKSSSMPPGNVFTFANSEVGYYLNRKTVWDSRLFFVTKKEVPIYLDAYNVKLIVLPRYLVTPTTYNFILKNDKPNTKKYWGGNSVPLDSGFFAYIQDQTKARLVQNSPALLIYERL
jgi:4-amino-4-deoxy-L-arabinose transferase-like glycosyltransferase